MDKKAKELNSNSSCSVNFYWFTFLNRNFKAIVEVIKPTEKANQSCYNYLISQMIAFIKKIVHLLGEVIIVKMARIEFLGIFWLAFTVNHTVLCFLRSRQAVQLITKTYKLLKYF